MKMPRTITQSCFLGIIIGACGLSPSAPRVTMTPLPQLVGDTFFTGCAYLDENTNGEIDAEDAPLGGFTFVVTLAGGAGFAAETSESHCALATVPLALPRESWPVVARMELPEDVPYVPIGPVEVTLVYPESQADFLFGVP